MITREQSIILNNLYERHNSHSARKRRFQWNKNEYKKWLNLIGYKHSQANWKIFKASWRYKRTLSLEEFTKDILSRDGTLVG